MIYAHLRKATFFVTSVLMLTNGALALEAQDFADKFSTMIKQIATVDVTFGSVTAQGNTIVLGEIDIPAIADMRAGRILDVSLTFEGVFETEDGGYRAESARFSNIDFTEDGVTLKVSDMELINIRIPGNPGADPLDGLLFYQGLNLGPISVSLDGTEFFSIDSISVGSNYDVETQKYDSQYEIVRIFGDLEQIPDPEANDVLSDFGLNQIIARMDGDLEWSLQEGRLVVNESSIEVENLGRLDFTLDLDGYTLELVKRIQEVGQELADLDTSSDEYQARSLQMGMALIAELSLNSMSVRFDDSSITNKITEYFAKQVDVSSKQFISQLLEEMRSTLQDFSAPVLQAQILQAVTSYLKDPQNLEVEANPDQPLPFIMLAAGALDPSLLVELLGISVTANQ